MNPAPVELPLAPVSTASAGRVAGPGRESLLRRARRLSLLSIGWMTVEAGVAITAAVSAGSVALLGFGLDSVIELVSALTILWLYTSGRADAPRAERRAQQVITICFAALAPYLVFAALDALVAGRRHDDSWRGLAVTVGALVFMPLLAHAKDRVAAQLGSAATAGDASQSWLCAAGAAAALLSLSGDALLGWWWLDAVSALGIAGLALQAGRNTWHGRACADCAPVGFGSHRSSCCDDRDCCG
jgi:divalent metal cation (Fe/Co/Zn/Cd) transporter